MRHLTLRLASLCGETHAAVYHGWRRLAALKAELKPALAQLVCIVEPGSDAAHSSAGEGAWQRVMGRECL